MAKPFAGVLNLAVVDASGTPFVELAQEAAMTFARD